MGRAREGGGRGSAGGEPSSAARWRGKRDAARTWRSTRETRRGAARGGRRPRLVHRLVRLAPASCTVLCTPPTGSPVQVTSPAYEAEQRRCDAPKPSDGGPERLRRHGDRRSRRVAHRFIGRSERAGGDPDSANATHVRAVDGVRRRYAGADRVIATAAVYGDGCAIVERSSSATSIFGRRALKRQQQRSSSGSRVE